MTLSTSCTEQQRHSLTHSMSCLRSACIDKTYSHQQRIHLLSTFTKSFQQLLTLFKQWLNQHGFVVCSPKSVLRGAFKAGFISHFDCQVLLAASEMFSVLTGSYDDENVLLPELLIASEYAPALIRVAQKFSKI